MLIALHSFFVAVTLATQAARQDTSASVSGQVRASDGEPVARAMVQEMNTRRTAVTGDDGRFLLGGLPPGKAHLRAMFIGYQTIDMTLSLPRGGRRVWNVTFPRPDWDVRRERAESALAAIGGLDSVGTGLIATDTSVGFTFQRFGIRLLQAAVRHSPSDSSRVLSPLSAGQALALALGAAKDSTALLIAGALDLGALGAEGLASRSQRFKEMIAKRRDITLTIANALWVDTSAILEPRFERWARSRYDASVRTEPLRVDHIVSVVNRWADSVTNGRIPGIRNEPFSDSAVVALVNAVYFKGRWLNPFDTSLTRNRMFRRARGDTVSVPTMERTGFFAYRRGTGFQALRLPYNAGLTALYLVLPDSGITATSVLDAIEKAAWPTPDPRHEGRAVQVRLPRLHLVQATDLRPPLTDLGVGIAFDSTRADFGGLVVPRPDLPPPCPPLSTGIHSDACTRYRIYEATQHVYLDLDETGTEAAAVTAFSFDAVVTSAPPPPLQFFVDRSFLFALRDEKTGTLLFVGYVVDPTQ